MHSFVTPDTRERDLHPDGVTSGDYRDDSHIDIVTWLHVAPHGKDFEAQHQAYLKLASRDSDRFISMRNETEWHKIDRTTSHGTVARLWDAATLRCIGDTTIEELRRESAFRKNIPERKK